jgi:transposase-like protein
MTRDVDLTATTHADSPFVSVGTDKATGRAIIGLDAAAVDALTGILDDLVNSDSFMYSDDADHAQQSHVAHAILRPLLKLQGFVS